ncbi:TetR family transcriptional regulator [Sinomonas sp. ASV486]|uniref:TetR/AcrR family transcriptional regulator n=1 Tax=Sinomonas sp. ASV486 TaxID=3051170 RepID=UPI0027DD9F1F|nr:TetR family transcriptional regulator [Sinomonas sp. ASV486]MDQ4490467.1 TetR family transcriptional regulator [Sinomonas sp. ASV486]
MSDSSSPRVLAKAERRQAILGAAAGLFAAQGFAGASLEDLGAAAGVSGPAIYRHFAGKQAVLGALLVGVSEELLAGGQRVSGETHDDVGRLRALVTFHVDFALSQPDVIRVQDRDFPSLAEGDRERVRALQLAYVDVWVDALRPFHPDAGAADLRMRAQAVFGLINSTPRSVRRHGGQVATSSAGTTLASMALAALTARV